MNYNTVVNATLAIVSGVIGLAVLAVLVSPKAQTSTVIGSSGNALATIVNAAVSPVTGNGGNGGASPFGGFGGLGGGLDLSSGLFGGGIGNLI